MNNFPNWTPFQSPNFLGDYLNENPITRNDKFKVTKNVPIKKNKRKKKNNGNKILYNNTPQISNYLTPEQYKNYQLYIHQYFYQKQVVQLRMYKHALRQQFAMQQYIQQQNNSLYYNPMFYFRR